MNPHHNSKDSIGKRLVRRHGTAVAYVALFAALGGSAYAAVTITGANIKDGTVTGKDVKNRTLSGVNVKNDSLSGLDVKESSLAQVPNAGEAQTAQRAQSAATANTAQRAQSAATADTAGAVAPNAVTSSGVLDGSLGGADIAESTLGAAMGGYEFVSATSATDSSSPKTATPECPPGKRYVFGGYTILGGFTGAAPNQLADVVVTEFTPNADGRRIIVTAHEEEPHAGNWRISAYAICLTAP